MNERRRLKITDLDVQRLQVGGRQGGIQHYAVTATDRQYNTWLTERLAILITSREMATQKLEYLPARLYRSGGHLNPMQPHWLLCSSPAE